MSVHPKLQPFTFPVAVSIGGKVEFIPYMERDGIFAMNLSYAGFDSCSGYEIYMDAESGKLYAADVF